jgi:hypothetical protein
MQQSCSATGKVVRSSSSLYIIHDSTTHQDTVSEWLRRWTRNPLGSARRGSNPLAVAAFMMARQPTPQRCIAMVGRKPFAKCGNWRAVWQRHGLCGCATYGCGLHVGLLQESSARVSLFRRKQAIVGRWQIQWKCWSITNLWL